MKQPYHSGDGADAPELIHHPSLEKSRKIDLSHRYNKRLVIDIDGVLANEQENLPLERRSIINEAAESMRRLKQKGYQIILCTSRLSAQREATVRWLKDHNIVFNDILFGKPRGLLYIDDRGYRFTDWKQFFEDVKL